MGLLTFALNVTLDGCCDHREMVADDEMLRYWTRVMDAAGAMLFGRRTYELMEDAWPQVARDPKATLSNRDWAKKLEAKPKYVVSMTRRDTIGLIESVERMRGTGLALAPMTMAGMDDQWGSDQTISDLPARASAFHVRLRLAVVGSESTMVSKPRFAWACTINAACPSQAGFELSAIRAKQTSRE
jgi:hypothetical protein